MKLNLGVLLLGQIALARKPNILFILTDDQDKHMGGVDFMPQLQESVISKGVTYPQHFCSVSLCCPSRASIWTGRVPHNHNVTDVHPPYGGYPAVVRNGWNDNYLPLWMQDAGYNTYYVGKLWNFQNVDNYDSPPARGFNGSELSLDPYTYQYYNSKMTRNGEKPISYKDQYITDVMTEKAHGFLDEALSQQEPWMLTLAPIAPHSNGSLDPSTKTFWQTQPEYAPRHAHLFKDYHIPRDESFNEGVDGGVSWMRNLPALNDTLISYNDEYQRCRLRSLLAVDEMIGGLMKRLEEEGVLDNTYIFYTTDNGYHISQHRMNPGKSCGFDTDINVPLFIRGPGIPENEVFDTVTSHTDLAPTFLSLAGVTVEGLDGKPIPLRKDEISGFGMEHVGIEFWGVAIPEGNYGYRKLTRNDGTPFNIGVFQNNTYKGLRILGEGYNLYYSVWCSNERELYDLATDPHQITNIAATPSRYANYTIANRPLNQLLPRLDALMMLVKSCKEDSCRQPWDMLHPGGDVKSLKDALSPEFDLFYGQQSKVAFSSCQAGYLIEQEGPQDVDVFDGRRRRKTFDYGSQWIFFS